jgi:hypothetical protein
LQKLCRLDSINTFKCRNYESHKIKLNQLSKKKGPYAMNVSISKLE